MKWARLLPTGNLYLDKFPIALRTWSIDYMDDVVVNCVFTFLKLKFWTTRLYRDRQLSVCTSLTPAVTFSTLIPIRIRGYGEPWQLPDPLCFDKQSLFSLNTADLNNFCVQSLCQTFKVLVLFCQAGRNFLWKSFPSASRLEITHFMMNCLLILLN